MPTLVVTMVQVLTMVRVNEVVSSSSSPHSSTPSQGTPAEEVGSTGGEMLSCVQVADDVVVKGVVAVMDVVDVVDAVLVPVVVVEMVIRVVGRVSVLQLLVVVMVSVSVQVVEVVLCQPWVG